MSDIPVTRPFWVGPKEPRDMCECKHQLGSHYERPDGKCTECIEYWGVEEDEDICCDFSDYSGPSDREIERMYDAPSMGEQLEMAGRVQDFRDGRRNSP